MLFHQNDFHVLLDFRFCLVLCLQKEFQSKCWLGGARRAVAWDGGCAIKKALVTDRGNALAGALRLPDLEMHD